MRAVAEAMPMREWLAIERAGLLAAAGMDGEAEATRFVAGYHNQSWSSTPEEDPLRLVGDVC